MSIIIRKPNYYRKSSTVTFPSESYGICFKEKKCGNIEPQLLGDGLCLACWDLKQYQFNRLVKKTKKVF
tara:strand:+ start:491 stop:697 length:207 start_codon:yes stop_codon:yes gene_type:complete